jgi:predicted nucleotidyltransferase
MVTSQVDLDRKLDDFVRRLQARIRLEAVILYGSFAKGTAREWSDIDIAVVSPDFEDLSTWDRQETIARATVGRAYRLAPIGFSSSEYHNPGLHSFLREIIRTGRVVYQAK